MKLYVFDCGALYLDEQILAPGKNNASYLNQNRPAQWVLSPMTVYMVEFPGGRVLYDTGLHEDALIINAPDPKADKEAVFYAEKEMFLPQRLEQIGVKPGDITHVVQSHLHSDHAGYLYMFKNAEIITHENEFTQCVKNWALKTNLHPYGWNDFDRFINANLNWNLISGDIKEYKITEGVTVLNFGSGHTFGNLGLLVELPESGNYLLVSDALYNDHVINRLPGIVYDSIGYLKTASFIVKYAKERNAQIIYGHNRDQFAGFIKSTDGYYK
jgi:glyoxylase-like metal-dependent hydrolase (beta-lactamase superfamily II)